MKLANDTALFKTTSQTDIIDITPEISNFIISSKIREGVLTVFTPGSTASLTTIEFEPGAVGDLKKALDKIAPVDGHYGHNETWGDGNGYSHLRAAIMKPSLSIPIIDGAPTLGTWQQVILLDFDNKPRERQVVFQITGQ